MKKLGLFIAIAICFIGFNLSVLILFIAFNDNMLKDYTYIKSTCAFIVGFYISITLLNASTRFYKWFKSNIKDE